MRILVLGSGGREHALAWKMAQDGHRVICAPGNAGMAGDVEITAGDLGNPAQMADLAKRLDADMTMVGPEAPLCAGIVDEFDKQGLPIVGPRRKAARLEGSKVFAKEFMARHGIPTADFAVFTDQDAAMDHVETKSNGCVIKADGLAAGKGVSVCRTPAQAKTAIMEMMEHARFGEAGKRILVEDLLVGQEASYILLSDGENIVPLATSQDHKPLLDGDQGPNTGGMGAYSPAPLVTEARDRQVLERIVLPTVRGMAEEGLPYKGVLYVGLMFTKDGPKVLEYNCRFGDPETQPLVMRLDQDLAELLAGTIHGLPDAPLQWKDGSALAVVLASQGYPGTYEKGFVIQGIEQASRMDDIKIFFAGVEEREGRLVTAGGRVAAVTALAGTLAQAKKRAYQAVSLVSWPGMQYRRDIGDKGLAPANRC